MRTLIYLECMLVNALLLLFLMVCTYGQGQLLIYEDEDSMISFLRHQHLRSENQPSRHRALANHHDSQMTLLWRKGYRRPP